ncbi:unnamed protein product, partial [Rotaria socialis]
MHAAGVIATGCLQYSSNGFGGQIYISVTVVVGVVCVTSKTNNETR